MLGNTDNPDPLDDWPIHVVCVGAPFSLISRLQIQKGGRALAYHPAVLHVRGPASDIAVVVPLVGEELAISWLSCLTLCVARH